MILVHCLRNIVGLIPSPPESISWATTLSQFYAIRVFNWNAHSSNCSAVHYNILSSNCGSCPTTTNHTSVTCTGVPTGGNMCTFSVQTVVCGNLTGELSQVLLYNSDAPGRLKCFRNPAGHVYLLLLIHYRWYRIQDSSYLCSLSWCSFAYLPYWVNNSDRTPDHTLDKIQKQGWNCSGELYCIT